MTVLHFVVPDGIDDPTRPSGGNVYDRRLCRELDATGWQVREHPVSGAWPTPTAADLTALGAVLAGMPDGATVLLDGLVASTAPQVLLPEARRLRLVVLMHMPSGEGGPGAERHEARAREGAVLSAAAAVVASSAWTRCRLIERHPLRPDRVHVVEPGVDPADLAAGTAGGGALICVAAVTPLKGHDVLLAALAMITRLPWHCTCVGSLDRDRGFVERLRTQAEEDAIGDRVHFTGPLTGEALDRTYARADLLVLASRAESYGMVLTEALARGLPVVATAVGGVPHTLGGSREGPPGLLVPPDTPTALAEALRAWLEDAGLRRRLRQAAEQRRTTLAGWPETADRIAHVIGRAP